MSQICFILSIGILLCNPHIHNSEVQLFSCCSWFFYCCSSHILSSQKGFKVILSFTSQLAAVRPGQSLSEQITHPFFSQGHFASVKCALEGRWMKYNQFLNYMFQNTHMEKHFQAKSLELTIPAVKISTLITVSETQLSTLFDYLL